MFKFTSDTDRDAVLKVEMWFDSAH
jgi:hypothetical protein